MTNNHAIYIKGSMRQSIIGHALELAGQLLVRGELDRARRVLCEIRADLERLTLHTPHTPTKEPGDLGALD